MRKKLRICDYLINVGDWIDYLSIYTCRQPLLPKGKKKKIKNLASVMNSGLIRPEQVMKHKLHKEKEKEIYDVVSNESIW